MFISGIVENFLSKEYLPGVMKTFHNKHFVISLNFSCLIASLLSRLLMSFFFGWFCG